MTDNELREAIVRFGGSLYQRGLAHGSAGNISVRLDDGYLVTPTNSCLGQIDPAAISKISVEGRLVSGDRPSKELALHLAVYAERPTSRAIVHLHSTYSVAVSCLEDVDATNVLPPLTPYCRMKVGLLPLVPYHRPGDERIAELVRGLAGRHSAILLANHGPIVAGTSLETTVYAMEELEASAKLALLLRNHPTRPLTATQLQELDECFGRAE